MTIITRCDTCGDKCECEKHPATDQWLCADCFIMADFNFNDGDAGVEEILPPILQPPFSQEDFRREV